MKIKLEKIVPSKRRSLEISLVSVFLALLVQAVIFFSIGINPLTAYSQIFYGAFGSFYGLSETIVKTIPLLLCAIGLGIAFKAGIWNIGSEGQLILGAIAATYVAFVYPNIILMFIAGMLAGAGWALIAGLLKAKLEVNEVISTLMLNYIALNLLEYLVYGPWKGSQEWGFPYTNLFPLSARIPRIPGTRIHYYTLAVALLATGLYYILKKTKLGYKIKVVGQSRRAAEYGGISFTKIVLITMFFSGALAGIAGVGEVAGIHYRLKPQISPGYGYTAIIVAWLGRLDAVGILLSSLFVGSLFVGGDMIQVSLGLPFSVINVFNGLILIFLAGGEFLSNYKIKVVR